MTDWCESVTWRYRFECFRETHASSKRTDETLHKNVMRRKIFEENKRKKTHFLIEFVVYSSVFLKRDLDFMASSINGRKSYRSRWHSKSNHKQRDWLKWQNNLMVLVSSPFFCYLLEPLWRQQPWSVLCQQHFYPHNSNKHLYHLYQYQIYYSITSSTKSN